MKKHEALSDPNSCLNKAETHEPIFILRANDPTAPQTIRHWATMNHWRTDEKIDDALAVADQMEKWLKSKTPCEAAATPVAPWIK